MPKKQLEPRETWQSWFEEFLSEMMSSECIHPQKKNPCLFLVEFPSSNHSPSERQVVNGGQTLASLESSICNILFYGKWLFLSPAAARRSLCLRKIAGRNHPYSIRRKISCVRTKPVFGPVSNIT